MSKVYFTGDDWTMNATLKQNGALYDASAATAIEAAVVYQQKNSDPTQEISTTSQLGNAGEDLANGLIVVKFPSASTANVTKYDQDLLIEIQVTNGGEKITWPRKLFNVQKGTIS